ncbi:MAG: Hpt domain-containing protein [Gammaproteobacteria bacterium]|nr:Hpt domain-containing protein [Gammaproteobacteria bacterium]
MLERSHFNPAVSWVREDLDDCLETVREHLEAYARKTDDSAPLEAVLAILERLKLTFRVMDQEGATMLSEEMIATGRHMLNGNSTSIEESLNALTDAIVVLPSYLDRLQAGHEDLPILLLPTLNELRATHDESLLSEGTLFAPELDVIVRELSGSEADHIASSDFPSFAKQVRGQYQAALLGWLQEQSKDALIEPMQAVCQMLYTRLRRNELRRLWWIADRVMQGLRERAVDNDLPLRRLFARLDLILKAMVDGVEDGPASDTITALSRSLLFYAAQARPGSTATDTLRERFSLDRLIPDREALLRARGAVTGRDAELFASIGDAVREELTQVKDTLDMELRTGRVDLDQRRQSKTSLRQLSDTLNMLNLPVAAKAVEDLLPALEATDGVTNMDLDSPLLVLAQKLLEVESKLATHIQLLGEPVQEAESTGIISLPPHEQRQVFGRMLDECVSTLQEAQEAIRKRLDGDADADFSGSLQQIAGAMSVATQPDAARLTEKLERALNAALAEPSDAGSVPGALLPLADAVAALELFLTGSRDDQGSHSRFLDIMAERLDGLPEAGQEGETLPETEIERAAAEPEPEAPDGIDPTMLGIFLDEFDSVHGQLEDQLFTWLDEVENTKALGEIRRAFHTLKGSGRMVGAAEIGDFAWRFEEVLNNLIDGRIAFSQPLSDALTLATGALNSMRDRLVGEDSDLSEDGINALSGFARQLNAGDKPDIRRLSGDLPEKLMALVLSESDVIVLTEDDTPTETPKAGEARAAAESKPDAVKTDLPEPQAPVETEAGQDTELRGVVIAEIRDRIAPLAAFADGLAGGDIPVVTSDLVRCAHTLAGTFATMPLGEESNVARALEAFLERSLQGGMTATADALEPLQTALHRFRQRLYTLESGNTACYPQDDVALIADLTGLVEQASADGVTPVADESEAATEAAAADPTDAAQPIEPVTRSSSADENIDVEEGSIVEIFLEEATEVLERCDTLLNTWRDQLSDQRLVQNLQREIHTFKGGARMAGLEGMGHFAHSMENLLEQIAENRVEATILAVQLLEEGCDSLNLWVEKVQAGSIPNTDAAQARLEKRIDSLHSGIAAPIDEFEAPAVAAPVGDTEESPAKEVSPEVPEPVRVSRRPGRADKNRGRRKEPPRQIKEIPDKPSAPSDDTSPGAQIRVAADLMDKLVNYSGEVSIYRSRLEQQMGSVRHTLKDVDATVQRLKEQLRKMDMESEAQMTSRYQTKSDAGMDSGVKPNQDSAEFDPLELDRFSNMQQLSRGLAETVSDLLNLHEMLDESVRSAENLLAQQSRVSSDLQEGLMKTRMTPFGSAAPRLRRVVRTAAAETGKKARLELRMAGSSDQLDRNVLERITAPLEHMLRNAIAHGIESPKVRKKAKKPEEGSIAVTVESEATEFVIRVQDDGAGINLGAVRKRAIERGLLDKDAEIDPKQLLQFIRHSGFSTAETVTGLAGRGVGMDVVNAEIKQIGGSLDIESEEGKGSQFIIRIPFSLAVMQAIGVSVSGRLFQIPLNSVAGVARVSPAEYTALMASESPAYQFAGEDYPLLELEPLLDAPTEPLDSDSISLLMISAGDFVGAFRVNGLQGHQEVVIKPVGPQISSIPGILGGTIAADGQVMLILDMGPLIRKGLEMAAQPAPAEPVAPRQSSRKPLVMVVDDSITMRKVNSRVLENHSLEVITAQDGVDAVEKLHDRVPDLMLLDIEMPRMDGYELLQHMRADARLRHVPVVMITSRAGQKHRKKAREAGANDYLTKPYQEPELVEKVGELLDMQLTPRRED